MAGLHDPPQSCSDDGKAGDELARLHGNEIYVVHHGVVNDMRQLT